MKQDMLAFKLQPEPFPPVSGKTPAARQASLSGARYAVSGRGAKSDRIRALLTTEALSRQDVSARTGIVISSVCSLMDALIRQGDIVAADQETYVWPDQRVTYRTRWKAKALCAATGD